MLFNSIIFFYPFIPFLIMKNYLISELGIILDSLYELQKNHIEDDIYYGEIEYVIIKTKIKIKHIENKNISSPYKVFKK